MLAAPAGGNTGVGPSWLVSRFRDRVTCSCVRRLTPGESSQRLPQRGVIAAEPSGTTETIRGADAAQFAVSPA